MFSITHNEKYKIKDPNKAIISNKNYGPAFGGGGGEGKHDLMINTGNNKESFSDLGNSYSSMKMEFGSFEAQSRLGGNYSFMCNEIEVYTIE